jgi:hypothetical protein
VAVGASLDDSGARGEYIRKGTDWAVVEQNRQEMLASMSTGRFLHLTNTEHYECLALARLS